MDLKHITKAELYRQLCKEQEKLKELEEIVEKSAEHARKQVKHIEMLEKSAAANDEIIDFKDETIKIQGDHIRQTNLWLEQTRQERDWLKNHPWKNLLGMEIEKWND